MCEGQVEVEDLDVEVVACVSEGLNLSMRKEGQGLMHA